MLAPSDSKFPSGSSRKPDIGLQLYTVRGPVEMDPEGALRRIAEIGFVGIEYYPLPESISPTLVAKLFKDLGLIVLGMHLPLPVGEQRGNAVKLAEIFHCDRVVYPGWPQGEKYKDLEATKRTMEVYNDAAAFFKKEGLRFGLHNHWWEFGEADGIIPFYYLLKHVDKSVFFEIDTYWAKTAGQDPAKVITTFGPRAPLLHIKDGPAVKGEKMYQQVPIGDGSLDLHAIAKAAGSNTEWMIVEFDEYDKDIFDGIAKSYRYLTKGGLARGKV
jgi:sugar phosphate isomerase/epimerase